MSNTTAQSGVLNLLSSQIVSIKKQVLDPSTYTETADEMKWAAVEEEIKEELSKLFDDFKDEVVIMIDTKTSIIFKYKGSVASEAELPSEGNTVGDVYNVEDTGANYAWDGTKWDKLSETIDLSKFITVEDFQTAVQEAVQAEANVRAEADQTLSNTIANSINEVTEQLETAVNNLQEQIDNIPSGGDVDISGKVDKEVIGSNGKALIFNESDGGGAKFEFNNNHASFVGVNDDSNGIMAQIYAKDTTTNIGSRINVTKDGIYYTVKNNATYTAEDEIAVKKDLAELNTQIEEALNEIDIKTQSIFRYKGSVADTDALPTEDQEIGDVYNVEADGHNVAWNGTDWDKLSETIDLSAYVPRADFNQMVLNRIENWAKNLEFATQDDIADLDTRLGGDDIQDPDRPGEYIHVPGLEEKVEDLTKDMYGYEDEESGDYYFGVKDRIDETETIAADAMSIAETLSNNAQDLIMLKGIVNSYEDLPNNAEQGDIYYVVDDTFYRRGSKNNWVATDCRQWIADCADAALKISDIEETATSAMNTAEALANKAETLLNLKGILYSSDDLPQNAEQYDTYYVTNDAFYMKGEEDWEPVEGPQWIAEYGDAKQAMDEALSDALPTMQENIDGHWDAISNLQDAMQTVGNKVDSYDSAIQNVTELADTLSGIPDELQTVNDDITQLQSKITELEEGETYLTTTINGYEDDEHDYHPGLESRLQDVETTLSNFSLDNIEQLIHDESTARADGDQNLWEVVTGHGESIGNLEELLPLKYYKRYLGKIDDTSEVEQYAQPGDVYYISTKSLEGFYEFSESSNWEPISLDGYEWIAKNINENKGMIEEHQGNFNSIWDNLSTVNETLPQVQQKANNNETSINGISNTLYGYEDEEHVYHTGLAPRIDDLEATLSNMGLEALEQSIQSETSARQEQDNNLWNVFTELNNGIDNQFSEVNGVIYGTDDGEGNVKPGLVTEVEQLQTKVDSATSSSNKILSLREMVDLLEKKINDLQKSDIEVSEIDGEGSFSSNMDYILSGTVTSQLFVSEAHSVLLKNTTVDNGVVNLYAYGGDIDIKNVTVNDPEQLGMSEAVFTINTDKYVTIRDCSFDIGSSYNGVQFDGMYSPKSILIDNVDFNGEYQYPIIVQATDDDSVITISNCHFGQVNNVIALHNKENKRFTLNIINCTCDSWGGSEEEESYPWAGLVRCVDDVSGSIEAEIENNLYGKDKVTINIQNLTKPDGTKLTAPEDMSTICGSMDANQILYVITTSQDVIPYDEDKYPTINIL